ncbi:hypothetical protein [Streptomyces sp. NPDC006270]|uniref:hypothetical protein n=1 Tax=Streptomyces sp. NPDC006270 TaxID=3364741 RepID=UPI0036CCFE62
MREPTDWTSVPSPGRIAAGLAYGATFAAVLGLLPRHAPEPERAAHDDGGGSSFVLDLSGTVPVLVTRDRDVYDVQIAYEDVRATLDLAELPGPYAHAWDLAFSGAARWDGASWTPAVGVPGRVVTGVVDDRHLLSEADIALAEVAEGESDPNALAALLAAVRAGAWDRDMVEAAVRLTPYEDDEDLEAHPDPEAAFDALERYAHFLEHALAVDRGTS